jgi:toxin ParE1/3/4
MRFEVLLTADAHRDLEDLFEYIAVHDEPESAMRVLDRIEQVLVDLARFPDRGSHPRELLALGIREYRQVVLKPYRIIYRVLTSRVLVYLIADGRRDMQTLLAERLIRPR